MKRLSLPLVLLIGVALTACGPGAPTTSSSGTPAPTVVATPSDDATPTPESAAVVDGFELSGTALIAVDADGDEIASHPLTDARGLIDALTALHGAPASDGPTDVDCDIHIAVWMSATEQLVVAYDPGGGGTPVVVVSGAAYRIRPSAGPAIGENATAFAASLPPGQSEPGYAYVYDVATTAADGTPIGGVAFIDSSGNVESLASPSPPYGTGFC